MKYIRTKDGIVAEIVELTKYGYLTTEKYYIDKNEILKQADTIEELCDEFVVEDNCDFAIFSNLKLAKLTKGNCYGAIWTDKGLIYVAKMNDKGDLELL